MTRRSIDAKLNSLLMKTFQESRNGHLPPLLENRIYTNRNIKLNRIKAIGFDMDYTLAEYQQDALDQLTMRLALETLVRENDYPESIMELPYQPEFAIRGLAMDTHLGNVLKMDKFHYVSLAYHGSTPLDSATRAQLYNNDRISFSSSRYRSVDTLFEILETYLYAALIEHLEGLGRDVDFKQLYTDLRGAIDLCHRDGSLKKEIMATPERFIKDDPLLVPVLHMFREAGIRLFILTNSEPEYTSFMLDYLFRNAEPFFKGWRGCFEMVGSHVFKPGFFHQGRDLKVLEDKDVFFFSGGNIAFLESKLEIRGDQVLYIGDHIYGDILKSKHSSSWRTCIIVPELQAQIRAEQEAKPMLELLSSNENRRKQLSMELNWRRGQIYDLQQFKEVEADELEPENLEHIDTRIVKLNRQLEENHKELSRLLYESRDLRRKISNCFNQYWGRLFKAGDQLTSFAEQIRDYACIYTSRVSNFNYYGTGSYLRSVVTPMPHEDHWYSVSNLNFDLPMGESSRDSQTPPGVAPEEQVTEQVD